MATQSSVSLCIVLSLTPERLGCSHILDTSSSVAVLITCLEALQKDYTLLQVGVRPIGAKLELDLLMHIVTGRKLSSIIEDDRGPAEALPELVQWCEDGILPVEKSLKNYPVKDFGEAREVVEPATVNLLSASAGPPLLVAAARYWRTPPCRGTQRRPNTLA